MDYTHIQQIKVIINNNFVQNKCRKYFNSMSIMNLLVVVCCYCRNTSPAIVSFLTTRRVKSADLHEADSSPSSDLTLSIVTDVEVKEAEAREPLDATEGTEVGIEAIDFGAKCEDDDNETKCTFIYITIILI